MQFAQINNQTLRIEVSGPKNADMTLVFVNSLGSDLRIWDGVIRELEARLDDVRIIRYDKRGHGLSDLATPFTMSDHVKDLSELIDTEGSRKAVICGLSVGGQIALGLSQVRPELLAGLILSNTAHKIGTSEMWQSRIDAIEVDGVEGIVDQILERWFSSSFHKQWPHDVAGYRNMLVRTPKDGYLNTCAAIRDADFSEAAAQVRVPTLCIAGEQDGSTPPELVAELAALVLGANLEIVDGAVHLPGIEYPQVVADLIVDHMNQIKKENR